MRDSLRWFLHWFSSFVFHEEASGGATLSGSSVVSVERNPVVEGRARVGGSAFQFVKWDRANRLLHHRFRIGDIVYVPFATAGRDRFRKQIVRELFAWNGEAACKVDLGWFPDRIILSPDHYRAWLRRGGK
jgi:hypothetical protein